ncbi:MAG: mucoidy inhibitor MuiA family protein [Luteibaculum sp.]
MQKILFSFCAVVLSLCCIAQPQKVSSKIQEALVFLQGAEITREAKVNLQSGQNNISLTGLCGSIDYESIQISGIGSAKISYLNLEQDYLSEVEIPGDIKKLLDEYEDQKFKLEIRQKVKDAYQEEKKLLLANQKILGENSKLAVEDLTEMADLYRNRLKEVELKILDISREEKELQERVNKLGNQLGSWKQLPNKVQNSLEIGLYSPSAQSLTLRISYLVSSAGWAPTYDLIANDGENEVSLVYKASVHQSTGVNWDNISLNFSTGRPLNSGTLPELYPDYVHLLQQANIRGARTQELKSKMYSMAEAENAEIALDEVQFGYNMDNTGVNTLFKAQGKHSISTFGKMVSVSVNEIKLKAKYEYLAIPKISQNAFLTAVVSGYEDQGLLEGPVKTYYKGALTGSSYIYPNSAENELKFSLGVDNQIAVERKAVKDLSKGAGIITGNKKSFHYKITVKNNRNRSVKLLVKDQVPISKNAEVEVSIEDLSGAKHDTENGSVSWNIEIPAAGSESLDLKYSIKYPKGERINH